MAQIEKTGNRSGYEDELRRFLAETADSASISCMTICNFLELRDNKGAHYATLQLMAYARAALGAAELLVKPAVESVP